MVPSPGSRLAGEHEYAFKHVLIRDVAYSTLPKSVRARKHAQVGGFIEERAGDRSEGVVGDGRRPLRASRRARRRRRPRAERARAHQPQGSGGARERRRCRRLAVLEPGGARATTRRRCRCDASSIPPRGRGSARSWATSRFGSGGSTRRSRCGSSAWTSTAARRTWRGSATCTGRSGRGFGTRAIARARSSTTRRGSTCSRTARPVWSWCACTRRRPRCTCTRATTCSRSTPPRRRCGSPSDWARRRQQAAPTGSSAASSAASATPSARVRTWSARSSSARESDLAEAVRALLTLGYHLEISEAEYEGRGAAYSEALELAEQVGDLPSQVELHAALAQLAVHRGDWETVEREAEASAASPSARD